MPGASTVTRDRLLNWFKGTAYPAVPTTTYLGLYTSATGPGAEGTEVTGGAYARAAITSATGWSAISTVGGIRQISNAGIVSHTAASAGWGTPTHFALSDALTAGNRLAYGTLAQAQVVNTGDTVSHAIGALKLTMA